MNPPTELSQSGSAIGTGHQMHWLFWLGILPLALALRLWGIETQNLWLDELYSLDVARKPLGEIVRCAAADIHPPLFYFVLKAWMRLFGDGAAAVRSLSVVTSVVALISVFRLIAPRYGHGLALTTTLLMAVSAHQIFFAQEARMYALVTALLLGALQGYAIWRESNAKRGLALYFWCSLAALYCHYFAALAILVFNAHFFLSAYHPPHAGTQRRLWSWLRVQGALGLLYAPWGEVLVAQVRRGQTWRTALTPADTAWQAVGYLQETLLGHAVYLDQVRAWLTRLVVDNLTLPRPFFTQPLAFKVLFLVFLTGWMAWGLGRCLQAVQTDVGATLPLLWLGLPLLAASVLSLHQGSMELARYLMFTTPAVYFLIAAGVHSLRGWQWRLVLAVCCAGGLFWQGGRAHYATTARDSDLRPALAFVRDRLQQGDRVVIDPDAVDVCLAYYAPRYGLEAAIYPTQRLPTGEPTGHSQLTRLIAESTVRRAWVLLDYRSEQFELLVVPGFDVVRVVDFPHEYPKVRVVEITRQAGSR